jgi:hypothetical protein
MDPLALISDPGRGLAAPRLLAFHGLHDHGHHSRLAPSRIEARTSQTARPLDRVLSARAPGMQTGGDAVLSFGTATTRKMPPDWQPEDPRERECALGEAANRAAITLAIVLTALAACVLVVAALAQWMQR